MRYQECVTEMIESRLIAGNGMYCSNIMAYLVIDAELFEFFIQQAFRDLPVQDLSQELRL